MAVKKYLPEYKKQRLPMARSKSSKRWLEEHFSDPFVKKAQQAGYRSRSAYKLLEIQQKDHLLKKGMIVVDLGAAPGGWTQVASQIIGPQGKVVALDILPMDSLENTQFIQADFTEDQTLQNLLTLIQNQSVHVVLSDMAPNMSGISVSDQAKSMYLAELAFELTQKILQKGGSFLVKTFQGEGFDCYLKDLRKHFTRVKIRKPSASRGRSKEIYLLAEGYRPS